MEKINGYVAAPFTPLLENGDLNLDLIPKYAELLIRSGLDGVFVCGSTGEGALLIWYILWVSSAAFLSESFDLAWYNTRSSSL